MGKNRKPKQVANQSSQSDSEIYDCFEKVPVEFLTSDDFQVVQNKRHNKRSPDLLEEFPNFSRSRHNSCRISDSSEKDDEALGCHSSFWTNKSQIDDKPDCVNGVESKSFPALDIKTCKNNTFLLDETAKFEVSMFEVPPLNDDSSGAQSKSFSNVVKNENHNVLDNEVAQSHPVSNSSDDLMNQRENENGNFSVTKVDNTTQDCRKESISEESLNYRLLENSCYDDAASASKKKIQKKKKKKLTKLETVDRNRVHQTSSESSSIEYQTISLTEVDSKEEQRSGDDCQQKKGQERKRPSKKQLAAIHEALKKAKEEEERLKKLEESKKNQAEEAEKQRLELMKREQEKKEKKKLKEKSKREKLKAEGRLLSKSQKQARARLQATIEIYRQQGVDIPQIGDKIARTRCDSFKNSYRKRFDSSQSDQSEITKPQRHKTESFSSQESKESSDIPSSFDSKDSLDLIISSSLRTGSDSGRISCSEESDALNEDYNQPPSSKFVNSAQSIYIPKMKSNELREENVLKDGNNEKKLRSPVVCVLGHVDTGKTKLLDFIRKTHVQDSEAGGITQQIGATMIPQSALKEKCKIVKDFTSLKIEVPGLLVIDTPGHESFRNLRSRGTLLCDIAVLVVDIMHGLQAQTLESINLLKANKIPFVVALNKVDRIYGWKSNPNMDMVDLINSQNENTVWDFKKRCQDIILQFAKEYLNAALFYENNDPRSFVSMVPTSAITGEGIGNTLSLITQLTQSLMHKKLKFSKELKATVLEVKVIPGLGTTIDVILVNGHLREGDTIVLAGQDGPIVSQIRSLLMPHSLKELRVKNPYIDYKVIEGAQGVKVTGKDLDKTLAGMPLFVADSPNKVDALKAEISQLLSQFIHSTKTSERGVYVQASTLGSLEALLDYLTSSGVPYFGVKIGPVVKKDVMKASIMLEHDSLFAVILAFDVKIEKDAQDLADHLGVKILHADIIYHLFDMYVEHRKNHLKKLEEKKHLAIFPCILTLMTNSVSESGVPLVLDVVVEAGTLKQGTPLCVPKRGNFDIGNVASVEIDHALVTTAKEGQRAIITVEGCDMHKPLELELDDNLVSRISRQSIEVLKEYYKDEMCPSDWHLIGELKKVLNTA